MIFVGTEVYDFYSCKCFTYSFQVIFRLMFQFFYDLVFLRVGYLC